MEREPSDSAGVVTALYEPAAREKVALDRYQERRRARTPSPSFKAEEKGKATRLTLDHPHIGIGSELLMAALGTTSADFTNALLHQLIAAGSKGSAPDEQASNFMLAVVKSIEPRDEIEAMLAAQMAAVHMATMTFARRLNGIENIAQQDSAERAFNKLARTFTTQMEALKRYRTGGQRKVVVEHVTVNAGGQAVVGVMQAGGGASLGNQRQPHAKALLGSTPDASLPPLRGQDAEREPMPVTSDA